MYYIKVINMIPINANLVITSSYISNKNYCWDLGNLILKKLNLRTKFKKVHRAYEAISVSNDNNDSKNLYDY